MVKERKRERVCVCVCVRWSSSALKLWCVLTGDWSRGDRGTLDFNGSCLWLEAASPSTCLLNYGGEERWREGGHRRETPRATDVLESIWNITHTHTHTHTHIVSGRPFVLMSVHSFLLFYIK